MIKNYFALTFILNRWQQVIYTCIPPFLIPRRLACKASVSARVPRQSCDESKKKKTTSRKNSIAKPCYAGYKADLYYTQTDFYAVCEINLSWCVPVVFIPIAKKEYHHNKVHSACNACVIYSGFSIKTNLIFLEKKKKMEGMPTKRLATDGIGRIQAETLATQAS